MVDGEYSIMTTERKNIQQIQYELRDQILNSMDIFDFDDAEDKKGHHKKLKKAVDDLNSLYQKELK